MTRIEKYKDLRLVIAEEDRKHEESIIKGNFVSIWIDSFLKCKGKHCRKDKIYD